MSTESSTEGLYFEVAVAAPIFQTLSYTPPPGVGPLPPGHRLLVPLGGRRVTGYLLACHSEPPFFPPAPKDETAARAPQSGVSDRQSPRETVGNRAGKGRGAGKIKAVLEVMDPQPLFPAAMVPLFRWIADYYHHPIGEVIQSALPSGISRKSVRRIRVTPAGAKELPLLTHIDPGVAGWLGLLLEKGELTPAQSAKMLRENRNTLGSWERKGWLTIEEVLGRESVRAKNETVYSLLPDTSAREREDQPGQRERPSDRPLKPSEQKTLELLRQLAAQNPCGVPRQELTKKYSGASRTLNGLLQMGLIESRERRLYRDPFGDPPPFFSTPEQLTEQQQRVVDEVLPAVNSGRYTPFLLHGITGSGKTEIYLQAAAAALEQGRQVLVLVPEIALATQLEGHFCSRFGNAVALLHSGLTGGQRFDQWSLLLNGEAKIAIGARSAIFAPLDRPGLIVVDEEHDAAYKQEEGLRYNARDLALLRGMQQNATVILGSATPAVSSYHSALKGKFKLLEMDKRVEERELPSVEIVDLKEVKTISGFPPLFSPQLIEALKENLAAGHQSLIFLNRRGWANLVICKDCGRPVQCEHCRISLTLHKKAGVLLCHHCGYHLPRNTICPHCRSGSLVPAGFGTERLEAELRRHFSQARIARLDQDTTRDRKEFLAVLKAVRDREVDILIGTQMITKGHHFPRVTLVGVVWADAGLGIPDYKAAERTFQLLTQVTGRAGRGEYPGRVIIQTLQAEHYSVALAKVHDYRTLYRQEVTLRRRLNFPPFGRLINLRLDGADEERVREMAICLGDIARKLPGLQTTVLGPAPAPISRLKGRFRWQLLLKGERVESLHRLCRMLLTEFTRLPGSSTVKLSLDVDPENML